MGCSRRGEIKTKTIIHEIILKRKNPTTAKSYWQCPDSHSTRKSRIPGVFLTAVTMLRPNYVAPCLAMVELFSLPSLSSSHLFISSFFLFVYSSIGSCHGEGRCPWRKAQQDSIFDGKVPEGRWILKQPVPNYLTVHPCHPVAFTLLPDLVCSPSFPPFPPLQPFQLFLIVIIFLKFCFCLKTLRF